MGLGRCHTGLAGLFLCQVLVDLLCADCAAALHGAGTLAVPLLVLAATALAIATKYGAPSISAAGPQGFSETLYAYTSQGNNNGSAFAAFTGFVQPNGPGNVGAFGITFADVLGALPMIDWSCLPEKSGL